MSVSDVSDISELKTFAKNILKFLTSRVFCPDGRKNFYRGNIPINLDASFNMGEKALIQCHPNLDISWMQLLSRLTFIVMWKDNIPIVIMHYHHEIYNITYTAECPYSIQLKILNSAVQTTAYKSLCSLLHDIFETIMVKFINHLDSVNIQLLECVCLANWDIPSEPEHENNSKRKLDKVDP